MEWVKEFWLFTIRIFYLPSMNYSFCLHRMSFGSHLEYQMPYRCNSFQPVPFLIIFSSVLMFIAVFKKSASKKGTRGSTPQALVALLYLKQWYMWRGLILSTVSSKNSCAFGACVIQISSKNFICTFSWQNNLNTLGLYVGGLMCTLDGKFMHWLAQKIFNLIDSNHF